jgi:RNA polymerase sigma-70 factor (ECF subfamily)
MQITRLLQHLETGDKDIMHSLIPLVYDELKKLARTHLRRELRTPPLETTALVHETFLKLSGGRHPAYENRAHFFGISSRLMRQILIDSARASAAEKRRAEKEVPLADLPDWGPQPDRRLLAMNDALQVLEKADPLKAKLVEMRFFGGLTVDEISAALGRREHTVRRELRLAQAWLRLEMSGGNRSDAIGSPGQPTAAPA